MHWIANRQTAKLRCMFVFGQTILYQMNQKTATDMFICMILHILYNLNKTPTHCLQWHIRKLSEWEPTFRSSTLNGHHHGCAFCFFVVSIFSHGAVTKAASGAQIVYLFIVNVRKSSKLCRWEKLPSWSCFYLWDFWIVAPVLMVTVCLHLSHEW